VVPDMSIDDGIPKTVKLTTIKPSWPPVYLIGNATSGIEPLFMEYQRRVRTNPPQTPVVIESKDQLDVLISDMLKKKQDK
jgi:hypothetical protein